MWHHDVAVINTRSFCSKIQFANITAACSMSETENGESKLQ